MKVGKTIGASLMILLVGVISFISIFGIYTDVEGNKANIIQEYKLGMEFSETDDLILTVKEDANATKGEYEKAKDIIKSRLNKMKVGQYTLSQDESTGDIKVQVKQTDESLYTLINVMQRGVFNIVDSEDNTVLLDNNHLKNTKVMYSTDTAGISVYLVFEFNEEGAKKLEEISQKYIETTTEQENEAGEMETVTTTKNVSVKIDDVTYSTTYFGETMTDGTLYIHLMSGLTQDEINLYTESLEELAIILNNGVLPDIYDYSFETSEAIISGSELLLYVIGFTAVLVFAIIYLMIRFKSDGVVMGLMEIGYVALLLLAVRYTNVIITITGVIGIVMSAVFNYIFLYMLLEAKENKKSTKSALLEFLKATIPVYVTAIVFTFIPNDSMNSIGMTLFWGSAIIYIFNFIFTKPILKMGSK